MVRFLAQMDPFESLAQANRNLRAAIARVAASLGNTPTICRKCYIHPTVVSAYLEGEVVSRVSSPGGRGSGDENDLRAEEIALLALIRARQK
jgi:DNA topoisomerase-1